jgi:hypothetical protein
MAHDPNEMLYDCPNEGCGASNMTMAEAAGHNCPHEPAPTKLVDDPNARRMGGNRHSRRGQ